MAIGPIQLLAINFEEFVPAGKILPAINAAAESGAIRLIDLQFVRKNEAGQISSLEMSGLGPAEQVEFGAILGGMIGTGMAGQTGAEKGTLSGALAAAEGSYGMTPQDVLAVADTLEPGGAAALMLIEHAWATEFRDAVAEAGGELTAQGFLTPQTLFLIGAELEAQAEAIQAIALSEAIQEEAALEALEAVELAEEVKAEVGADVVRVLVDAAIIEEASVQDAMDALDKAGVIKEEASGRVTLADSQVETIEDEAG